MLLTKPSHDHIQIGYFRNSFSTRFRGHSDSGSFLVSVKPHIDLHGYAFQ